MAIVTQRITYRGVTLQENTGLPRSADVEDITGTGDPTTGGGITAPVGSSYRRSDGQQTEYVKTGPGDVQWLAVGSGPGGTGTQTNLGYYVATDYGIVGDNSTDNRAAVQALVDAVNNAGGGAIYFPPGTYRIGRNPLPGATNIGSINIGGFGVYSNIIFIGAGKSSRLVMVGPGTAETMFRCLNGSSNIHFRWLYFAQGPIDDDVPDEQMHLIEFAGIADFSGMGVGPTDCSVVDCWFGHVFGDQIRLLGEAATPTTRIRMVNNQMDGQDHSLGYGTGYPQGQGSRSCIGVQRSCHQLSIIGNQMKGSKDQLVDYEPSGAQENQDHDVLVGNTFDFTDRAQLVTLGGDSASSNHRRFIFEQNTIKNGKIFALNVSECSISHNVIVTDTTISGRAGIHVRRAGDRTRIIGNHIHVPAGSASLQGINITGDPAIAVPHGLVISGNVVFMENDMGATSSGIQVADSTDVLVESNLVWLTGTTLTGTFGIIVNRTTANVSRITVRGNILRQDSGSSPDSGICISQGTGTVGAVVVEGNQVENCTKGIRIVGGTTWSITPIVANNSIRNCTTPVSNEVTGLAVAIGGNVGGVTVFTKQGGGSPEGAITAVQGSLYLNTSGGAGVTLYVKETGTGNTGWVAK